MTILQVHTPEEIERTASLAEAIWTEHYTPLIGAGQVAYMIDRFQSVPAIRDAIEREGYRYYIAAGGDGDAAYCGVKPEENGVLFLSKLYVLHGKRGQGLARRLVERAVGDHPGTRRVWLTVNKGNAGSIAAYGRMGFVIERELVTDIGNGFVMDDYLMALSLPAGG